MEKNIHIELLYHREEKEEMKEEATHALNNRKITTQEYEQLICKITSRHKAIVDRLMKNID